jgi:hypothetical protein
MSPTRLIAGIALAVLLAACGSGGMPAGPPGLTIPGPPGSSLTTLRYTTTPETAARRGNCSSGYVEVAPPPSPSQTHTCIYDEESPHPIQAQIGVGYPFVIGMPCFVTLVQFDGRLFVSDGAPGQSDLTATTGLGTMTLVSPDHARFVAQDGKVVAFHAVSFVRQPICE